MTMILKRIRDRQGSWFNLALKLRFEVLLTLCWTFLILVLFLAPVPLTLDGPSHVYGSQVLRQLIRHRPEFEAYFEYNSVLVPNWLSTIVLAALSSVMPVRMTTASMMTLVIAGLLAGLYSCVSGLSDATGSVRQRSQVLLVLTPLAISAFLTLAARV
jgi:fluoride ion exporter CrcB/FEX